MSPSKMAENGLEIGRKRRLMMKKLISLKKNKIGLEGKPKNNPQVRMIKNIVKENGTIPDHAFEAAVVKKQSIQKKKKKVPQNKKKGLKSKGKPDDEYVTEEEEVLGNNTELNDVPMSDQSGTDSIKDGKDAFSWLIAPIKPEEFFRKAWEKAPLHVKRTNYSGYYAEVLSSEKINSILQENYVLFSKNIDVTSYRNGERETHNPAGRAIPSVVWDFYQKGCSVRMLNPQTFCPELRKLNATLQEFFGCFVGANSYLTPANSQGFAPHYDDIEAFILQIEGRKLWKVYAPRNAQETLPRFSSENFHQEDLQKPVLEVTLNPGDLLYFPRGYIHQASTEPGYHSLHVTISCYQKNSWGDLLEKLLPATLAVAQEEDVEFRKGLPLNYLRHLGVSNSESNSEERRQFFEHLQKLWLRLLKYSPVDASVDQMGKQFMHDALPPVLNIAEEKCSVGSENMKLIDGSVCGNNLLCLKSRIKLIRSHILRLVKEDSENDNVQVYHCVDNSLEYHGEEPQMFEVSSDFALTIEHLIHSYPAFVSVASLELESEKNKLELANMLWRKGLLLVEEPLKLL